MAITQAALGCIAYVFVFTIICVPICDGSEVQVVGIKTNTVLELKQVPPKFCTLSHDHGPCIAALTRFYFDNASYRCRKFIYGGCRGNENKFTSIEQCNNICSKSPDHPLSVGGGTEPSHIKGPHNRSQLANVSEVKPVVPPFCNLSHDHGPCIAALTRFYFDNASYRCRQFIYGGCRGNENKFTSIEQCNNNCAPHHLLSLGGGTLHSQISESHTSNPAITHSQSASTILCGQPSMRGPCAASFSRWYYNVTLMTCQTFTYGGCYTNGNNFLTTELCHQHCGHLHNGTTQA